MTENYLLLRRPTTCNPPQPQFGTGSLPISAFSAEDWFRRLG